MGPLCLVLRSLPIVTQLSWASLFTTYLTGIIKRLSEWNLLLYGVSRIKTKPGVMYTFVSFYVNYHYNLLSLCNLKSAWHLVGEGHQWIIFVPNLLQALNICCGVTFEHWLIWISVVQVDVWPT
jgi:hypothetical protein